MNNLKDITTMFYSQVNDAVPFPCMCLGMGASFSTLGQNILVETYMGAFNMVLAYCNILPPRNQYCRPCPRQLEDCDHAIVFLIFFFDKNGVFIS